MRTRAEVSREVREMTDLVVDLAIKNQVKITPSIEGLKAEVLSDIAVSLRMIVEYFQDKAQEEEFNS